MNNKFDEYEGREICFNCKSMIWSVGIGQGVKCRNKKNYGENGRPMQIRSREHSCEYFEKKGATK